MASELRTWNISECAISLGAATFSGGADGEVLSIEWPDDYGVVKGSDGEVTRYATNDNTAMVKMKLMQTSQMIPTIMALRNSDVGSLNGAGIVAFQVENLITGERINAPSSWLVKPPDMSLDRTPTVREFSIQCVNPTYTPASL